MGSQHVETFKCAAVHRCRFFAISVSEISFSLNGTGSKPSSYTIWILRQVSGWGLKGSPHRHIAIATACKGSGDDGTNLFEPSAQKSQPQEQPSMSSAA